MSNSKAEELVRLRNLESKYIKELDYLPSLNFPLLLRECHYGALGYCLNSNGYRVDNFLFKAYVGDRKVEYSVIIAPQDITGRSLVIRHILWKEDGTVTHFTPSQYGKWDKHLDLAVDKIRDVQTQYVQNKLKEVKTMIVNLESAIQKEKELFESFFD